MKCVENSEENTHVDIGALRVNERIVGFVNNNEGVHGIRP